MTATFATIYQHTRSQHLHWLRQQFRFPVQVAEDVVQEAAWRLLRQGTPITSLDEPALRCYFARTVQRVAIDHYRRQRYMEVPLSDLVGERSPTELDSLWEAVLAVGTANPETILLTRQRIQEGLAPLSPASKRIVCFFAQGFPLAEIARREGRSLSAVKMALSRARQAMEGKQ